MATNMAKTYRFKIIHEALYEKMKEFASFHSFEDRDTLKDSYKMWLLEKDVQDLVEQERKSLMSACFDFSKEPLETKIFKSIKYYHIKKILATVQCGVSAEKSKPKRIKAIQFSKTFIELAKQHIQAHNDEAPAQSFQSFLRLYENQYDDEMRNFEHMERSMVEKKIKKMYKNVYSHI